MKQKIYYFYNEGTFQWWALRLSGGNPSVIGGSYFTYRQQMEEYTEGCRGYGIGSQEIEWVSLVEKENK